jgi:hypothetical protein
MICLLNHSNSAVLRLISTTTFPITSLSPAKYSVTAVESCNGVFFLFKVLFSSKSDSIVRTSVAAAVANTVHHYDLVVGCLGMRIGISILTVCNTTVLTSALHITHYNKEMSTWTPTPHLVTHSSPACLQPTLRISESTGLLFTRATYSPTTDELSVPPTSHWHSQCLDTRPHSPIIDEFGAPDLPAGYNPLTPSMPSYSMPTRLSQTHPVSRPRCWLEHTNAADTSHSTPPCLSRTNSVTMTCVCIYYFAFFAIIPSLRVVGCCNMY